MKKHELVLLPQPGEEKEDKIRASCTEVEQHTRKEQPNGRRKKLRRFHLSRHRG